MKSSVSGLLITLMLLAVLPGAEAQAQDENLLGLFYDSEASIHEIEVSPNSMHTLYLVLINPVNEEFDGGSTREVEFISGFECAIEHPSGDVLLDLAFPTPGLNLGSSASDILAGFAPPIEVSSQRTALLATFSVLTMGNNPEGYRLIPFSIPSHSNTMAYADFEDPDDNIVDMVPASGSFDRPVFTFGDYTVETEAKWGEVKALYR